MTDVIPLALIDVAGSPEAMGRSLGSSLGPLVKGFVRARLTAMRANFLTARRGQVDDALAIAAQSLKLLAEWDEAAWIEHGALAAAAEVDAVELYAAAGLTDFRDAVLFGSGPHAGKDWGADSEGCSSVALPASLSASGRVLMGQSWDLNPPDLEFVVAVKRRPDTGPASWTLTCAGCPAIVGLNELGVYVGTTNIKTPAADVGIPYVSTLYRALRSESREAAVAVFAEAQRAGAHTYLVGDGRGAVELESDAATYVRRELGKETALCRTNHCLDAGFQAKQAEATSDSSRLRLAKLHEATQSALSVEALKALFANRDDGVHSLNRYPEDAQGTATNAVIIYDTAACELHVCRGPADRGAWHILRF